MGKLYPGPLRGTWTPVLTLATPGDLSVAYSTQLGEWYLDNGMLRVFFVVITSTFTHTTASGSSRITGLPFAAKTATGMIWTGSINRLQGVTKANYTHFGCGVASAGSLVSLLASGSAQTLDTILGTDMPSGTAKTIVGTVTYPVA